MNNKKIVLLSVCFFILFLSSIFFFNKNNDDTNLQNLTIFDEVKIKINDIANTRSKDRVNFRWIKEGYTILVPANNNFYINKQSDTHLEFTEVPNLFKSEINITEDILQDNNFVFNKNNSSKNFSDRTFYDYIQSYQKDDELCVIKINPDDLGYYQFSFVCGNSLNQVYEEQLPFLEALNYKNTNNFARLINKSEDFYQVGVGGYRGGSTAILKKEGAIYRVLYISQEDPNCEEIENENIPNSVLELFNIKGCWDGVNGYKRFGPEI